MGIRSMIYGRLPFPPMKHGSHSLSRSFGKLGDGFPTPLSPLSRGGVLGCGTASTEPFSAGHALLWVEKIMRVLTAWAYRLS